MGSGHWAKDGAHESRGKVETARGTAIGAPNRSLERWCGSRAVQERKGEGEARRFGEEPQNGGKGRPPRGVRDSEPECGRRSKQRALQHQNPPKRCGRVLSPNQRRWSLDTAHLEKPTSLRRSALKQKREMGSCKANPSAQSHARPASLCFEPFLHI